MLNQAMFGDAWSKMQPMIKAWTKAKRANNFNEEHNTNYTFRGYQ